MSAFCDYPWKGRPELFLFAKPGNTNVASQKESISVGIIGGGLAGLAAATALAGKGFRVELFESRSRLGGRAGAFWEPAVGQWIDFGHHVLMGCCRQMLHFCEQTGLDAFLCRYRELCFVEPGGRVYRLKAHPLLPAPLHLGPSFFRLGFLSWRDRLRVVGGLVRLMHESRPLEQMSFGQWLFAQGQTPLAIQRFWTPVLLSTLAEVPERVAFPVAQKVFVEGLLGSRDAYQLLRPSLPWGQLLEESVGQWLADRGVVIHRKRPVRQILAEGQAVRALVLRDGGEKRFDFYIVAVPWRQAAGLVCPVIREAIPQLAQAADWPAGAITTWHVWLDRSITPQAQTAVVGKGIQWVFAGWGETQGGPNTIRSTSPEGSIRSSLSGKSRVRDWPTRRAPEKIKGMANHFKLQESSIQSPQEVDQKIHYYQVIVSASHALAPSAIPQTIQDLLAELQEVFPAAQKAQVLAFRQVKISEAVFSPQPAVESCRPGQKTPLKNLALAGDWTATGWPATMESAVRSGYQAAQVILDQI
jgi:squalene-associated FAD-dependent desaturase